MCRYKQKLLSKGSELRLDKVTKVTLSMEAANKLGAGVKIDSTSGDSSQAINKVSVKRATWVL